MIKDFEFYHGTAITKLIRGHKGSLKFRQYAVESNASYVLNDQIGLYIKYSRKRLSPWQFTFTEEHHREIDHMYSRLDVLFLLFVCGEDGVAILDHKQFRSVVSSSGEWLRIARSKGKDYAISGSEGKLKNKIGPNEFPRKVLEAL